MPCEPSSTSSDTRAESDHVSTRDLISNARPDLVEQHFQSFFILTTIQPCAFVRASDFAAPAMYSRAVCCRLSLHNQQVRRCAFSASSAGGDPTTAARRERLARVNAAKRRRARGPRRAFPSALGCQRREALRRARHSRRMTVGARLGRLRFHNTPDSDADRDPNVLVMGVLKDTGTVALTIEFEPPRRIAATAVI